MDLASLTPSTLDVAHKLFHNARRALEYY